jgi:hypothetical protein
MSQVASSNKKTKTDGAKLKIKSEQINGTSYGITKVVQRNKFIWKKMK